MSTPSEDPQPPTGLPDQEHEATPLGVEDEDPDGQGDGPEDQPGIPTDGDPPAAS